jgi:hypothetical protein
MFWRRSVTDRRRVLLQETDISHVQTYPASQRGHVRLSLATRELLGRDNDYLNALDRARNAHRSAGDNLPVVRCAFWLGRKLAEREGFIPAPGDHELQRLLNIPEYPYLRKYLAKNH